MATTGQKWFIGCGIGCVVVILAVALVIMLGVLGVKKVVHDVQQIEASTDAVTERFGRSSEFRPEPDGTIPSERLETFLEVRELMAPDREEMERSLSLLAGSTEREGGERKGGVFRKIGAGVGLIPDLFRFIHRRNEALLEAGMGLGEYSYIYAIAYYAWLGKSPADGPPFTLVGGDDDGHGGGDEFEVREKRLEEILARTHRTLLPMLRNQLADLGDDEGDPWRQSVAEEIEAMESDRYRLPWRDGLPEPLERSLEPYRERLEDSYSPLCNPLEAGLQQH